MKKDNSEHLVMLVQSLDEELKKLMKKVGYRKEKRAVCSLLSFCNSKNINRKNIMIPYVKITNNI